jgi:hypothetical protein
MMYLPATQLEHDAEPAFDERPEGHAWHWFLLTSGLKVFCAHFLHAL